MGIWTVFNAVCGLALLGQGLFNRRRTAIRCGAALLGFVSLDVLLVYLVLRDGQAIPAIGIHAVFLFPVAIWLAWKCARDLKPQQQQGRA